MLHLMRFAKEQHTAAATASVVCSSRVQEMQMANAEGEFACYGMRPCCKEQIVKETFSNHDYS